MELKYLSETQNEAFDAEYHTPQELRDKIAVLRKYFPGGPRTVLDVGGGNGAFLDVLLEEFSSANGTLLDVSPRLLELNKSNPRKTLICSSIDAADAVLADRKFDLITVNWLLHHLVGSSYAASEANCVAALQMCRRHLNTSGVICVAENLFESFGGLNYSNRLTFEITSIQFPPFVRLARGFFNTAGVGVAFRNEHNWRRVFRKAGVLPQQVWYHSWPSPPGVQGALLALLGLRSRGHGHFFCPSSSPE